MPNAPAKHMMGNMKKLKPSMNQRFLYELYEKSRQNCAPKINIGMDKGRIMRLNTAPAFSSPHVRAATNMDRMLKPIAPANSPAALRVNCASLKPYSMPAKGNVASKGIETKTKNANHLASITPSSAVGSS